MGQLHSAYLIVSVALVVYLYRSTFQTAIRENSVRLIRPLAVLVIAYISGLNVRSVGEVFASYIPRSVTEPVFYLLSLVSLVALSLLPFLRPGNGRGKPL